MPIHNSIPPMPPRRRDGAPTTPRPAVLGGRSRRLDHRGGPGVGKTTLVNSILKIRPRTAPLSAGGIQGSEAGR
jgi:hypothetical protein